METELLHYHLAFEKMLNAISNLPLTENVCFDDVKRGVVSISHRYFHSFDACKIFPPSSPVAIFPFSEIFHLIGR